MCFYSPRVYHPLPPFRPLPSSPIPVGPARGTTASAAPTAHPDQPATAPTPAEPSRIDRVISIVRWLIAYGTLLATAVREHPAEPLARTLVSGSKPAISA